MPLLLLPPRQLDKQHVSSQEISQLLPAELNVVTASLAFEVRRVAETFYSLTENGLLARMRVMLKTILEKGLSTHGIDLDEIDGSLEDIDSALLILTGYKVAQLCPKRFHKSSTTDMFDF